MNEAKNEFHVDNDDTDDNDDDDEKRYSVYSATIDSLHRNQIRFITFSLS